MASSSASEAPWPACGLVACAASPIRSVRLRDQVGSVATSSVVGHHDVFGRLQDPRDRIVPAGMEIEQMPLDRILAHGAKRRGVDAMRGLRAPPHHAVVGIGAAKAVAEKSALPERRHHALADRHIRRATIAARSRRSRSGRCRTVLGRRGSHARAPPNARRRRRSRNRPRRWSRRRNARRRACRRDPRWRPAASRTAARHSRTRPC